MYLKIISHACLQVKHQNSELVCDPWFLGSSYWRSWWNYPPVRTDDYKYLNPNFIYLTHLHWDHFHSPSLRYLGKDKTIIIPYDRYARAKRDLIKIGFKNIIELRNRKSLQLNSDFKITSYQFSPTCTDSALVIESKDYTILNLNDCKIFGDPLNDLIKNHPEFDFVLKSHSSANSRICYTTDDTKIIPDNKDRYSNQFYNYMRKLKPTYAIPFASNCCYLHKDTYQYNEFSQDPLQLKNTYDKLNKGENKIKTKLKVMVTGSSWDENDGFIQKPYEEWFNKNKSIKLQNYKNKNNIKLEKQYRLENKSTVSFRLINNYFLKFYKELNYFLKLSLKNKPICFKHYNDNKTCFVKLDFYNNVCEQTSIEVYESSDLKFSIPNIVLKQCIQLNMFSHGSISKRIKFFCKSSNIKYFRYFEYLLELKETEVIPLYKNFNIRSISNIKSRWREYLLYFKCVILMKVKNQSKDDIHEYYLNT